MPTDYSTNYVPQDTLPFPGKAPVGNLFTEGRDELIREGNIAGLIQPCKTRKPYTPTNNDSFESEKEIKYQMALAEALLKKHPKDPIAQQEEYLRLMANGTWGRS